MALRFFERRRLGLRVGAVIRHARDLEKEGLWCSEPEDHTKMAVLIGVRIAGENPKAFEDPGVDWDAIIKFIEDLMPLLLMLIQLFGGLKNVPEAWLKAA